MIQTIIYTKNWVEVNDLQIRNIMSRFGNVCDAFLRVLRNHIVLNNVDGGINVKAVA